MYCSVMYVMYVIYEMYVTYVMYLIYVMYVTYVMYVMYVMYVIALARTPSAWVGGTALRVREVCLWSHLWPRSLCSVLLGLFRSFSWSGFPDSLLKGLVCVSSLNCPYFTVVQWVVLPWRPSGLEAGTCR